MTVPFRIGVLQLSMEPMEETLTMAQACDAAGFDSFWLAEAYPWWRKHSMEARSSTAMTAVIARETTRIAIGWGIISPYTRHPVQIAMEARVLQDIAGEGRFLLGLGASKIFMKEIGEGEKGKEVGPAVVMRESLEIIEAMLSGRDVQYQGKAFSAFAPPLKPDAHTARWRVPMYVGATGPVLQRLAGSHADGLLTASITTPAFIKLSREKMEEGARKAGKNPSSLDLGAVIVKWKRCTWRTRFRTSVVQRTFYWNVPVYLSMKSGPSLMRWRAGGAKPQRDWLLIPFWTRPAQLPARLSNASNG